MRKLPILLFSLSMLLIGCSEEGEKEKTEMDMPSENETQLNDESDKDSATLSYEDYWALFEKIKEELDVEGLEIKGSTEGDLFTIVDKELTFGKREMLTVDGMFQGKGSSSTQETIFLENPESSILVTVTFAFTDTYIGNDMLLYEQNIDNDINRDLAKQTELIAITYKNLVITVLQSANEKRNLDMTQSVLKGIISILNVEK